MSVGSPDCLSFGRKRQTVLDFLSFFSFFFWGGGKGRVCVKWVLHGGSGSPSVASLVLLRRLSRGGILCVLGGLRKQTQGSCQDGDMFGDTSEGQSDHKAVRAPTRGASLGGKEGVGASRVPLPAAGEHQPLLSQRCTEASPKHNHTGTW